MPNPTIEQFGRWLIRHVRDESIRRLSNSLRGRSVDDPKDPNHRPHYQRLLAAGVPESAIPAVLDLMIDTVDRTLVQAVFEGDQLATTKHVRVSLLEAASHGEGERWMRDPFDLPTYQFYDEWIEDVATIATGADVDAIVRGPVQTIPWECPLGTCGNCEQMSGFVGADVEEEVADVAARRAEKAARLASAPLRPGEIGAFGELSARPNPDGLVIQTVPPFEMVLRENERQAGRRFTEAEIAAARDKAGAVTMTAAQAKENAEVDAQFLRDLDDMRPPSN